MRKLKNEELNRKSIADFKQAKKTPIVVVLDNVRSMNNIGSVFRTSDALLIEKICLCGITATPPNKDIHKTALGATDSVNWEHFKSTLDCVQQLQKAEYKVYAIEQAEQSISLNVFNPSEKEKIAVIFGNEVKGVDQKVVDICDGVIELPQYGTKHSFNISVCVGIVLWELFHKVRS
jgi:23S rRNA (guanosine2251-2'-O)-methyltransferase